MLIAEILWWVGSTIFIAIFLSSVIYDYMRGGDQ